MFRLFENTKINKIRTVKFLGIDIYTNIVDYNFREQKFLSGLINVYTLKKHEINGFIKTLKILGFPVFNINYDGTYKKIYICGVRVVKEDLKKTLKNKFKKIIKPEYDHIYILNCNSGEAFLFFSSVVEPYLQKNKTKNPLFIVPNKYHLDIMDILCPWYEKVYINNFYYKNIFISGNQFEIGSQKFFKIFPFEYFKDVEDSIHNSNGDGSVHYFAKLLEYCNVTRNELCKNELRIPEITEKYVLKKVRQETGLDTEKFVIIAPEAASCDEIEPRFWTILINKLTMLGYDIFMNITNKEKEYKYCSYKTCDLTYREIIALARHAKSIISLRSGLAEALMSTGTPLICINSQFKNRAQFKIMPAKFVEKGYDIKRLPYYNEKIHKEFNINSNLIENILQIIEESELYD